MLLLLRSFIRLMYANNHTVSCSILASFFWTTLLTFQLYSLVTKQNLGMSEFRMHLLSWLSCIALELIPLHNAEYGQDDIGSGVAWCSIANLRSGNIVISSAIWISVTFIVPLILCMTLMIIFYILIKMHYRYSAETINAKEKSVGSNFLFSLFS